ncbi:MAG: hypothetical protein WAN86_18505 [Hyphomicrobiaceae bacterium]
MKAQALIGGATYGLDALKVICNAFDDAWAQIAHHFDDDVHQAEEVRLRLALAILAVATDTSRDPEELKNQALQVLAMNYHELAAPSGLAR